jgi:hypothetical protein
MYRLFRKERSLWSEFKMKMRPWKWPKWQFKEEIELVKKASAVHAPSKAMLTVIEDVLGPLKKKKIIPNPCLILNNDTPTKHNKDNTPLILFVGKLNVNKGADLLASIIPTIAESVPNSRFWLIGADARPPSGCGLDSMQRFLSLKLKKLMNRITFSDRLPLDQVRAAYVQSSVCMIPSRWEAWGMVAAEAMSAGCPVVGTCHGGMPELIRSPKYGLVNDPLIPEKFAKAVIRLLEDNELRGNIITNAEMMVKTELRPDRIAKIKIAAYVEAGAEQ